jgi:hypothetical protein
MLKRIVLGGITGGVIVYIALSIVHMATGLGEVGVKSLPAEDTLAPALRSAIHQSGFYFFPAPDMTPGRTKEQKDASQKLWEQKWLEGPNGILIYSPGGVPFNFGKLLGNQFVICLIAAFLIAALLAMAGGGLQSYGSKVLFVAIVGLFAGVFVDLPYWNWYGFPADYTITRIASDTVCWAIAGLGMAKVMK